MKSELKKHSDTFPYLVIRAFSACYAIRHNLKGKNKAELILEAKAISKHFNRRVCLVMGPKQAFYIELDGTPDFESNNIPAGGVII